jgi:sulfite reductase beta subunit-like hemoprotein
MGRQMYPETRTETVGQWSGQIAAWLADAAPGLDEATAAMLTLHGVRRTTDRDFTVSVRLPGGRLAASQYLALDDIADRHGDGTLVLVGRLQIELPGVLKRDLKEAIGAVALARLTTFASGEAVAQVVRAAASDRGQERLIYDEIWLDSEQPAADEPDRRAGTASLPPLRSKNLRGWQDQGDGTLSLGLSVPHGRIADRSGARLRTALRFICKGFARHVLLTPGQEIVVAGIVAADRLAVESLLDALRVTAAPDDGPVPLKAAS